jgi:hypothetical protein
MSLFILLAQATALPPPPAPKSASSVSPLSIVLVVVIVLGSVAMIALSSRRFRRRPADVAEAAAQDRAAEPAPNNEEPIATVEPEIIEPVADPNLLARLRRVTGHQAAERRKLGNRKSTAEVAVAGAFVHETSAPVESLPPPDEQAALETEPAADVYPEPIPIRRRSLQRWQDEPVIAPAPLSSGPARSRASATGAALSGLTSEEVFQLEAPRPTARAAQPLPRLKPDATLSKLGIRPSVDDALLAELSATVRELLYSANIGELLHGFALYSDPFLFRTMDDTGLSEDEFRDAFEQLPAKPIGEWTRLADFRDLDRLTPELVEATVVYQTPVDEPRAEPERFRFLKNPDGGGWLIDDIRPADK